MFKMNPLFSLMQSCALTSRSLMVAVWAKNMWKTCSPSNNITLLALRLFPVVRLHKSAKESSRWVVSLQVCGITGVEPSVVILKDYQRGEGERDQSRWANASSQCFHLSLGPPIAIIIPVCTLHYSSVCTLETTGPHLRHGTCREA